MVLIKEETTISTDYAIVLSSSNTLLHSSMLVIADGLLYNPSFIVHVSTN